MDGYSYNAGCAWFINKFMKESLNPAQKKAVFHKDGPLLIVAGAGSGKTKALSHRIACLIASGVEGGNILAVTFTNKAANEMKERVGVLLSGMTKNRPKNPRLFFGSGPREPWIGTFHALGCYILRHEGGAIGLTGNFSILDDEERLSLIKEAQKDLVIDPIQIPPAKVKAVISRSKGELIDPGTFRDNNFGNYFYERVSSIWDLYEEKLSTATSVDFDDLLLKPVRLFRDRPDILKKYQDRWKYLNIDEYQDTNHAQYVLANLLAKEHCNICVVGDVDQCIYSWRGADFRNILAFERDWPGSKTITLVENYRSSEFILNAANAVIANNKERVPKDLFTSKKGGDRLQFFAAQDETHEAVYVIEKIKELVEEGAPLEEIAVLFRTNFQSRVLEEEFLKAAIPYRVSGVRFYQRKEIKDILAYIRVALNRNDLLSLKRIINVPPRRIGKALIAKVIGKAELGASEKQKVEPFFAIISDIEKVILEEPPSKALKIIFGKTGYFDMWDPDTEEGETRIYNLKELVNVAARYDNIQDHIEAMSKMLEDAALMSEQDSFKENKIAVNLMTVHAAKGLEFDNIFIVGLEEGLFPHASMEGDDGVSRGEEERRLFYVALTRARKKIFLSFTFFRKIFGEKRTNTLSRFLSEIPAHLYEGAADDNKIVEY